MRHAKSPKDGEDIINAIKEKVTRIGDMSGIHFGQSTNLDQVTLVMKMEQESDENVIEISEEKIKRLMPEYSKKKLAKACEILRMISEKPNISIDELRIALDVTDRTIARYISELKNKGIIERKGPDNGGKCEIMK